MNYREYLKTDHWSELRKAAIIKAGWRCEACSARSGLEVHHLNYHAWFDVTGEDLVALCGACHSRAHSWLDDSQFQNKVASSADKRDELMQFFRGLFNSMADSRNTRKLRPRKRKITSKARLGYLIEEAMANGLNVREH